MKKKILKKKREKLLKKLNNEYENKYESPAIELINSMNTKGKKKLAKLKKICLYIEQSENNLVKDQLIKKRSSLLGKLSESNYKEYVRIIESYFTSKENLLQYLFPYIIEYNKMQSKFITTRYYNSINLVVPFIFNFHKIVHRYDVSTYYNNEIEYSNINNYLYRKTSRDVLRTNKGIQLKCFKSTFYTYKSFFYMLQEVLRRQRIVDESIIEFEGPILRKDIIKKYDRSKYYKYPTYIWSIVFQDPIIEKFTNLFLKHGKKEKAEKILMNLFFQFHDYMRYNPLYIFKEAIENVRPYVCSKNIPFGRRTKTVPHPINEKQQIKLAMKWIKSEALAIRSNIPVHFKLMDALINASLKKGYAYNQMISLHTGAYAQRAYMYSNYYLRSSKAKNKRPF
ncbi:MAG: hypothetical protein LAT55_12385 [Opitutales bacterium]|nr:hypothetical protein [Opitutales bacterium]